MMEIGGKTYTVLGLYRTSVSFYLSLVQRHRYDEDPYSKHGLGGILCVH